MGRSLPETVKGSMEKDRTNKESKGWGLKLPVGEKNRRLKKQENIYLRIKVDCFQRSVSRNVQSKKEKEKNRTEKVKLIADVVKKFIIPE